MKKKGKHLLILVFSGIATLFLYIVLHEFGHVIVMLSAGDRITEFSILGAHVSGTGGNYTDTSDLWLHANGAFFPLLLSYIYLLFYRKGSGNTFYRIISLFIGYGPAAGLLAWVVIPLLYLGGNAPAGDDVTLFLYNYSQGHSPVIVSIAAAVLIAIDILLVIKKGVFRNFVEEFKSVR